MSNTVSISYMGTLRPVDVVQQTPWSQGCSQDTAGIAWLLNSLLQTTGTKTSELKLGLNPIQYSEFIKEDNLLGEKLPHRTLILKPWLSLQSSRVVTQEGSQAHMLCVGEP